MGSVAVLGLLLALLGGCGGGAQSGAPAAPTTPPPAPPAPQAPGVPGNLRVIDRGEGFIEWRWDLVPGAAGYQAEVSLGDDSFNPPDGQLVLAANQNSARYQDPDLPPGTTAWLRVRAFTGSQAAPVYGRYTAAVSGSTPGTPPTPPPAGDDPDRAVLEAFYRATGGGNWNDNSGWLSDLPLDRWHGVATDGHGRVTELRLNDKGLAGRIPAELGGLSNLQELDLSNNRLTGPIPRELGRLVQLSVLGLAANRLTGPIPAELGNLTRLTYLHLASNQLSGRIPPELGRLSNLAQLFLRNNQLTGEIPLTFTALRSLDTFWLGGNAGVCAPDDRAFQSWLAGVANVNGVEGCALDPDRAVLEAFYRATGGDTWRNNSGWLGAAPLGNWDGVTADADGRVTELVLGNNGLQGELPPELGDLARLTKLDLVNNRLRGTIPRELGNLSNLEILHLAGNQLSGAIPAVLGQLTALKDLWLGGNDLRGTVPPELGRLRNLESLGLHDNPSLTGPLPGELASLAALTSLSLQNTGLCAPADAAFQQWVRRITATQGVENCRTTGDRAVLEAFYRTTNGDNWTNDSGWLSAMPLGDWHGVTTDSDGRVTELVLLRNNLSGDVPAALGQLTNLEVLNLGSNRLSGEVPSALGRLTNLTTLYFTSNQLSGAIPTELRRLTNLTFLGLGSNELSGAIPSELGELTKLEGLHLQTNALSGGVPAELGSLTRLETLQLNNNPALSGALPDALVGLAELETLWIAQTALCAPTDAAFQSWLAGIANKQGVENCRTTGDRAVLEGFYRAMDGDNWTNSSGWLSAEPLGDWHGVTTNADGRVVDLTLDQNGLSGDIPGELGNLSELRILWLSQHGSALTGAIPPQLGALSKLTTLALHGNGLSGAIPASLGNLSNLTVLNLGRNGLSGPIPSALTRLTELTLLGLNDNALSGEVPSSLGNLVELHNLRLAGNAGLTGPLPTGLTALTRLFELSLQGTGICAPTDTAFQAWLTGIRQKTGVQNCRSTGDRGVLEALYRATDGGNWTNNSGWLSAMPLGDWHGVTTDSAGRVTRLTLSRNELSGELPDSLGDLSELKELIATYNDLSGAIPAAVGNLSNLTHLRLFHNNLSGALPANLGNLSNLIELRLYSNDLSGAIPAELGNLSNLTELIVSGNNLSGAIPPELGNLSSLTDLTLSRNRLTGAVPPELGRLTNLERLLLDNNASLSGPLPDTLTSLTALEFVWLHETDLCAPRDATLQAWLAEVETKRGVENCRSPGDRGVLEALYDATDGDNWTDNSGWLSDMPLGDWYGVDTDEDGRVTDLGLPQKGLAGELPAELGQLTNLRRLILFGNQLSGSIPPELGDLTNLERLHLDRNNLSGSIPPELGNLTNLTRLALGRNNLSGSIPPELGDLTNLETLGLDTNNLSGSIPSELGQLTKLWGLLLSENSSLSGPLPDSFLDLTEGEFGLLLSIGDTGLCVPPGAAFDQWLTQTDIRPNPPPRCDP